MNKSYCLIGLPHSGKSLFGSRIAVLKNKNYIDTDSILKHKYNNNLSNIIKQNGHNEFILKEEKIIKSINTNNIIISPGGSIIYSDRSLDYIKNKLNCCVINLHLSYDEFNNRLNDLNSRGIINPYNLSVNKLYYERVNLCKYYSDITFCANNKKKTLENLIYYIK